MDTPSASYEFGPFVLMPAEHRLLHESTPVHLPPKAFDLLVALAVAGGHLVEKAQLMKAVWQQTHVEEANLAQTVSVLRKALAVAPNGSLLVETVPKRGYRIAVEVSRIEAPVPSATTPLGWWHSLRLKPVLSVGAIVGATLACVFLYRTLAGH
jgi:DNA-binding winged helix-turn-helix (wHTH) protein